jgi:Mg2+-importing ATPase
MASARESGAAMPERADGAFHSGVPWISIVLGTALLVAVVVAALHFSEERAFLRVAEQAEPAWLGVAFVLQAGTYLAQGGIWGRVGAVAGFHLSRRTTFELGLAKLFADQVLPSAGVSSSILIAKALEQRNGPPGAVKAAVLINMASYHLGYVIALSAALVIASRQGNASAVIVVPASLFLLFSLALSGAVIALPGRLPQRLSGAMERTQATRGLLAFMAGADAALVRDPRVIALTVGLQLTIVLLDTATMWTLVRALGATASPTGVFASFMVASLFRTMGIVPGGLGTFEATSVLTLHMIGVNLAVALSATLLFRGLSFWLPMLPGYWCSRRAVSGGMMRSS